MKKLLASISFIGIVFLFFVHSLVFAANPVPVQLQLTPIPCPLSAGGGGGADQSAVGGDCAFPLKEAYQSRGESCAAGSTPADTYKDFLSDPATKHYWVEDSDITIQGKADDRARQFIYWAVTRTAIDNSPVLKSIWTGMSTIALVFTLIVAAVLGMGLIIGQRMQFNFRLKIWPIVFKIVAAILWITFSAAIILILIQFSEVMMKFFIENLGGKNLFNIYFSGQSEVKNYTGWVGCRDMNIRVQEGAETEIMMLKLTNITYYVMGSMLLMRKILLWFLLFVSPFLAILMPFVFIRNIGWIWIGVFFQWLFYGPLFALFLGATAQIWANPSGHIPFLFDFSKVNKIGAGVDNPAGYVFPTAINILYGGPAQTLALRNNGNYIDTFAEYIITLLMLWAVTFFPWWLLRIFRDYCCDGIMAMKNILLAMYDQTRGGPSPKGPGPNPISTFLGTAQQTGSKMDIPVKISTQQTVHLEKIEEVRQAKTEDIMRSMHIEAHKLTDIARLETDKTSRETATRNIQYLQNPIQAETPTQRQQFLNVKSELFSRAVKQEDRVAKQVLTTVSSSQIEHREQRQELVRSIPSIQKENITHVISVKVKLPQEQVIAVTQGFVSELTKTSAPITSISADTKIPPAQVKSVLDAYARIVTGAPDDMVDMISKQTGVRRDRVIAILKDAHKYAKTNKNVTEAIAEKQKTNAEVVQKVLDANLPLITEPQKSIESTITIPPTVSIEDYEEVKKMWKEQYEKGEVPVSENIKSREEWLDQDTVFITNTLNKLVSADEKIRAEGLDDLGYILPIFMINNFKGEEVLVYLKAKLEAAKEIQETFEKALGQEAVTKSEEEFVDVSASQKVEAPREMNLEQARTIDEPIDTSLKASNDSSEEVVSTTIASSSVVKKLTEIAKLETKKSISALTTQILSTNRAQIDQLQKQLKFKRVDASFAISSLTKIPQSQVTSITTQLLNNLADNSTTVGTIAAATSLAPDVVKKVIVSLSKNIGTSPSLLFAAVTKDTGASHNQVVAVTRSIYNMLDKQTGTVKKVAASENLKSKDVETVLKEQTRLIANPENNIEQEIALPPTVSIEDYEEVKKMWKEQYEKGEVPVSENIKSREEWLDQDTVFITNTLNKLLSDDQQIQSQGLQDLSYILPVFMTNNFSADEILVYLRAKLEAAKEVKEKLHFQQEAREAAKAETELVDIPAGKNEEVKGEMTPEQAKTIEQEIQKKLKEKSK